jgi:hypothetical protein
MRFPVTEHRQPADEEPQFMRVEEKLRVKVHHGTAAGRSHFIQVVCGRPLEAEKAAN